jgi:hypothetical protein
MMLVEAPNPVLAQKFGRFIRRGTLAGDTKSKGK